ncbi:MAG: shikimate dehydrogenase, partial [Vulcanimicrobiaceae bacterium]
MSAERLRLALIGDPVAHSRSPALFAEFFASERIEGSYAALRVPAGEGAAAIARLRAEGYDGLNVTTPLKEEAFASAALRDSSALAARAANVLVLGEQIAAHNSDGIGALGALAAAGLVDLIGKHVLVLGAG